MDQGGRSSPISMTHMLRPAKEYSGYSLWVVVSAIRRYGSSRLESTGVEEGRQFAARIVGGALVMKPQAIRISVVVPAFNVEDLISAAIESLLAQTIPLHEIIVVDDGSTDGTPEVVRRYEPRVRYIRQENAGPSAARNTGIAAATGEWVAFLDSDDVWLPDKVKAELHVLEESPDLAWVATNHYLCVFGTDHSFVRFDTSRLPDGLLQRSALPSFVQAAALGLGWDPLGLLVRREVLEEAGGFRSGLHYGEDLDLCLTISRKHPRIGFFPEPVAIHHIDRPEGLCRRQSMVQHMRILRGILDRHLPHALAAGVSRELRDIVKNIVQDHMALLLDEGRRWEMWRVHSFYRDLLPIRYLLYMELLGLMPGGLRRRTYEGVQWRIRDWSTSSRRSGRPRSGNPDRFPEGGS